jgi:Putative abortive phage resistance protein AbiGi, antitoxin
MVRQRYVSNELTHFVGASLRGQPDKQYTLLTEILRSGKVKSKHYQKLLYYTRVEVNSLGESVETPAVCFCDIPVADFEIHSNKYSKFGLAFTKEFLLLQGANPVFYVAAQSTTMPVREDLFEYSREQVLGSPSETKKKFSLACKQRLEYFEYWRKAHHELVYDLEQKETKPGPNEYKYMSIGWLSEYSTFINLYIFGFVKFFNPELSDDDPNNFYMEREWRVLNCVDFKLSDVVRVLIPKSYAERFRGDFPDYCGQLSFLE